MTRELLTYAAQTVICGGVLYALYRLLLERNPRYNVSRAYLILAAVAATLIPALNIPVWPARPAAHVPQVAVEYYYEYATEVAEAVEPAAAPQAFSMYEALGWGYALITAACLAALAFKLTRIRRYASGGVTRRTPRYRLVENGRVASPFSYRRTIFLPVGLTEADREHIILHESSHIRHRHSAELLVMEVLKCVCWFNPFVWLMRRSLAEVHEYQADSDAIRMGAYDTAEYQSLIFRQLFGCNPDMASGLTSPTIKKRFIMMTNHRRGGRLALRLLAIAPAVLALTAIFGFTHRQAAPVGDNGSADISATPLTSPPASGEGNQMPDPFAADDIIMVNATLKGAENPSPNATRRDSSLVVINGVSTGKTWGDFLSDPARTMHTDTIKMYKNASKEQIAHYGEMANSGIVLVTTVDGPGNRPVELTTNVEIRHISDDPSRGEMPQEVSAAEPIVLMNGAIYNGTLSAAVSNIATEAIQSFSVIKKISADLIEKYGERAKNGIVSITTIAKADMGNEQDGKTPYIVMHDMPKILHQDARFRDCADIDEFAKWVENNVTYPAEAKAKGIEGSVLVSFVVGKKGNVRNIEILDSPHESMSDEVRRILKNSAGWVPGMVGFESKTQLLGSKFTIPVKFRLQE